MLQLMEREKEEHLLTLSTEQKQSFRMKEIVLLQKQKEKNLCHDFSELTQKYTLLEKDYQNGKKEKQDLYILNRDLEMSYKKETEAHHETLKKYEKTMSALGSHEIYLSEMERTRDNEEKELKGQLDHLMMIVN